MTRITRYLTGWILVFLLLGTANGNDPPVVHVSADPNPVDEGSLLSLSVAFGDIDLLDTHTAMITWGDGASDSPSVFESGGSGSADGSHVYADNGMYTVFVEVTDSAFNRATFTSGVTVNNIAPTILPILGQTVELGAEFEFTAQFNDPGTSDTHTGQIDWDFDGVTFDVDDVLTVVEALFGTPG